MRLLRGQTALRQLHEIINQGRRSPYHPRRNHKHEVQRVSIASREKEGKEARTHL
jgi:hypothetical protein